MHYVVGDIHGCYDDWIKLKTEIEQKDSEAKFILIGDIVDRGPDTIKMINWALENITENGKYQMIMGNHEHLKIRWFNRLNKSIQFIEHRTGTEISDDMMFNDFCIENEININERYNFNINVKHLKISRLREINSFFRGLPLYKEIEVDSKLFDGKAKFLIVHANIGKMCTSKDNNSNKIINKNTDMQIEKFMSDTTGNDYSVIDVAKYPLVNKILWDRELFMRYSFLGQVVVIHGHTPTISDTYFGISGCIPGRVVYTSNSINIDCGCVFKGHEGFNLAAICLETLEETYVNPLSEKFNINTERHRQKNKEKTVNVLKGERTRN